MSCNCNTANPNCNPCAFCTPPGVTCLTTCEPVDPCPGDKIDLCCVLYSGEDHECSGITHGEALCDIILQVLPIVFPPDYCCALTGVLTVITTTTTTTAPPFPCNCYDLQSAELTTFSYIDCNGNLIPNLLVSFQGLQICGSDVQYVSGAPGTIVPGPKCNQGICP